MEKNIEVSLLLDFYGDLLKESGRQAVDLYYNEDFSLAEIADRMGITRQGVRDSIKRSERQLFEFESKLGMLKRYRALESGLEQIAFAATSIQEKSQDKDVSGLALSIEQRASELKALY